MKRFLGVLVFAACCGLQAAPRDLSADMVITQSGKVLDSMKIFISAQNSRTEWPTNAAKVTIVRRDRGVVWVLFPPSRQYTETVVDAKIQAQDITMDPPGVIRKDKIGGENVGGYSCTKYRITVSNPVGGQMTVLTWYADALGLSIRSELSGMVTEFRNIRVGSQSASLFEIPAGCQKTARAPASSVKLPAGIPAGMAEKMRKAIEQRNK